MNKDNNTGQDLKLHSAVWVFDTPVTLKQGQGHQIWY